MTHIRDGLTTDMKYAVVSSKADFSENTAISGKDVNFWGMLKPQFEASKIVEVMQTWKCTVYVVTTDSTIEKVAGSPTYKTLDALPVPVDCAIVSLPDRAALLLLDAVVKANIQIAWLQFGAAKSHVIEAYRSNGIRVVTGCVLLHWDIQHVNGLQKGRHICYMHGNLERTTRIQVSTDGTVNRCKTIIPETMSFDSETYGTRILLPFWPKKNVE